MLVYFVPKQSVETRTIRISVKTGSTMDTLGSRRILKANAVRDMGSKVVFNFEDIRRRCDDYVGQVRLQTEQMLEDARREADEIRQRAQREGEQSGLQQGLRHAEEHIERRAAQLAEQQTRETLGTALPALQAAAEALRQERGRWLAEWETAAVRLCIAVAEKLLRREVERSPECLSAMLGEMLGLVVGATSIRLRLHPDDLRSLGEAAEDVVGRMASCGEVTLIPDGSISRGGCVIDTQHGRIDAQIETQLERIASELLDQNTRTSLV